MTQHRPLSPQERQLLAQHVPAAALAQVVEWVENLEFHLTISRSRHSKLGDYRAPSGIRQQHRISVNGDLNPYAFLQTLVHEIAHLLTWQQYRQSVAPHGNEWKQQYVALMQHCLEQQFFAPDLVPFIQAHLRSPAAASCSDTALLRAMKQYNFQPPTEKGKIHIEDVAPQTLFLYRRKMYRLEEKRRSRYLCTEIVSGRKFTFSALVEVITVPQP